MSKKNQPKRAEIPKAGFSSTSGVMLKVQTASRPFGLEGKAQPH
jgi:hypothetical protein